MPERIVVAYATDLLLRGFHTTPPDRRTPDGMPANGLFAAAKATRRVLAFKTPELAVAVVDPGAPARASEPAIRDQLLALVPLFEALGFAVVASDRPADLVASYVTSALAAQYDAVVLGSDKRLAQLVGSMVWWYDAYKQVRYTPATVRKRFGVDPSQVADWLALVGDDTALAGVPGIGAKGAVTLLEAVGSLAAALDAPEAVEGRVGKALRRSLQTAREQAALAHLDSTLTLPRDLETLAFAMPGVTALNETYANLGFYSLLVADKAMAPCEVRQDAPDIVGLASLFALTEEPSPVRGKFSGLAVVTGDQRLFFPEIGPRLRAWLEDASAPKIGHDTKATVAALARLGVAVRGIVGDSVIASHLDDPSGSAPHELDQIARVRLRRPLVDSARLLGVGAKRKRWADLPATKTGAFACDCADAARELWEYFEPTLDREHFEEAMALSDTLVRMELAGIACDGDSLAESGEDFAAIAAELEEAIFALAGHPFNLGSTKQLGKVLYEELGLTVHGRTKTGWSTATHLLERLVGDHPIVPLVIRHRRLQRLQSNWVGALRDAIGPDGRVHSTFHPARSFSGRLVNSQPDLGRVPGQTPEMVRIRRAFVAPDGHTLLSVDYDQLGLYVLAHLTRDPALVAPLSRGDDMHIATAAAVLNRPEDSIGPKERQTGKVVNFATFAGQGVSALRQQLGVSVEEATEMIARFDRRYAGVRSFQDEQLRLAQERGWVETISGRRWRIQDIRSNDPQMRAYGERMARRAPHEGSVADITRRGLLRADQALRAAGLNAIALLQIHDEVLFEVPTDELAETARVAGESMRTAFELIVPLRVEHKVGPNWGDMRLRS